MKIEDRMDALERELKATKRINCLLIAFLIFVGLGSLVVSSQTKTPKPSDNEPWTRVAPHPLAVSSQTKPSKTIEARVKEVEDTLAYHKYLLKGVEGYLTDKNIVKSDASESANQVKYDLEKRIDYLEQIVTGKVDQTTSYRVLHGLCLSDRVENLEENLQLLKEGLNR